MITPTIRSLLPWLVSVYALCAPNPIDSETRQDRPALAAEASEQEQKPVQIHYLEIVTPDVEATCTTLAKLHGVTFSEPVAELGNARTAAIASGGSIGVRAPMNEAETPVVRPYVLVDDVAAATETAEAAGGEIMVPPMEIPGRGKISIYSHGGIQHGLWQR